ncbi:c2h2 type zinc finger domain [Fusarium sporotrichioides]|uniref:C2h2 type zinc finger domain n=1 Tax=Fusarium sporotrichioides TaxID=5514 RepID=A0A395RV67_FUSSP|nr:c2h2 type zinc finger domain [Fusarium sporotrichioides]
MPKVHKCSYCSREFKRPEHLRRHCRAHTGEKPYVCHCGACFTRNDLLRRHQRLAHTGDSEDPLQSTCTTSSQVTGLASPPANIRYGDKGNPNNYNPTFQDRTENPSQHSTPCFTTEVEDQDLASSRLDFEAFTRNMGLYIDLFDPSLFEPTEEIIREEDTPLGHEALQVSRNPVTGIKSDGPMPFSSWLAGHSIGMSFNQDNCLPEFVLALAALGAQQRYERHISLSLYRAGKAIALRRLYSTGLKSQEGACVPVLDWSAIIVQSASTLLTLIVFASWSANAEVVNEAFELHTPLMFWLREDSLVDKDEIISQDWYTWAQSETRIRVKLMAFCFFNLHTIAYNYQPILFWHEVNLRLPCTVREWHAMEGFQWLLARQEIHPAPSPFGNYVLLHGLLQRIHLVRQLAIAPTLQNEDVIELHKALSNWATIWQQTSESSLNPRDENGPVAFTSVALLGLAHVRLHLHIGPYRDLASRLPTQVAAALARVPSLPLQQTNSANSALLYSVHALSLPVAIGIDFG